jgi:hypothetical protein
MEKLLDFDYRAPYDLMVGQWNGMSTVYNAQGEYLFSTPILVAIYWKHRPNSPDDRGLLSYRQIEAPPMNQQATAKNVINFDLEIIGKHCKSVKIIAQELKEVAGTESRPDTYVFKLKFESGGRMGHYYINQYFTNPSERSMIGPFIWEGDYNIAAVVAQSFTRISYEVPLSAQSDI